MSIDVCLNGSVRLRMARNSPEVYRKLFDFFVINDIIFKVILII